MTLTHALYLHLKIHCLEKSDVIKKNYNKHIRGTLV